MEIEILNKKINKLFGRNEYAALVSFTGATPKRPELKLEVANKAAENPEHCVVREVKSEFGIKRVAVLLYAYDNNDVMKKFEPLYTLVREGLAQKPEKKKKEKKAAAPKKQK